MKPLLHYACILFIATLLTACGGSGGSGGSYSATSSTSSVSIANETLRDQRIQNMRFDFDSNGIYEGTATFSYNTNSQIDRIVYTYSDDGTPNIDLGFASLLFGEIDATHQFTYNDKGLLIQLEVATENDRTLYQFTWDDQDRLTFHTVETYDVFGLMQDASDYRFTYVGQVMTGWNEEFRTNLSAPLLWATVRISYNSSTNLPSMISINRLNGSTENNSINFLPDGRIAYVLRSGVNITSYSSSTEFEYFPENVAGGIRPGYLRSRRENAENPINDYAFNYVYGSNGLMSDEFLDLHNDGSVDSVVTMEFEQGPCLPTYVWGAINSTNFIAAGRDPFVPGTGYARLDYCGTRGSPF